MTITPQGRNANHNAANGADSSSGMAHMPIQTTQEHISHYTLTLFYDVPSQWHCANWIASNALVVRPFGDLRTNHRNVRNSTANMPQTFEYSLAAMKLGKKAAAQSNQESLPSLHTTFHR